MPLQIVAVQENRTGKVIVAAGLFVAVAIWWSMTYGPLTTSRASLPPSSQQGERQPILRADEAVNSRESALARSPEAKTGTGEQTVGPDLLTVYSVVDGKEVEGYEIKSLAPASSAGESEGSSVNGGLRADLWQLHAAGYAKRAVSLLPGHAAEPRLIGVVPSCQLSVQLQGVSGAEVSGIKLELIPYVDCLMDSGVDLEGADYLQLLGLQAFAWNGSSAFTRAPQALIEKLSRSEWDGLQGAEKGMRGCSIARGQLATRIVDSLIRTSDDDGIASWEDLPGGYSWQIMAHGVSMGDISECDRAQDTRIVQGREVAEHTAGVITLEVGQDLDLCAEVFPPSGVSGIIAGFSTEDVHRPVVKIYDKRIRFQAGMGAVPSQSTEWAGWAGADGAFVVEPLGSGSKRLGAWWREPAGSLTVANLDFELRHGEFKDLGMILPDVGVPFEVTFEIDGEGVSEELRRRVLETVKFNMYVVGWGSAGTGAPALNEVIPVAGGEPVRFSNVPEERLTVSLEVSDATDLKLDGYSLSLPSDVTVDPSIASGARLVIRLDRHVEQNLTLASSTGDADGRCDVHLISHNDGSTRRVKAKPMRGRGAYSANFRAAPGEYTLVATCTEGLSGASLCRQVTLDGEDLDFALEVGASVEIYRALEGESQSGAAKTVFFSPSKILGISPDAWIHFFRPDGAGSDVVVGLAPNSSYTLARGGFFETGSAGELVRVQMPGQ